MCFLVILSFPKNGWSQVLEPNPSTYYYLIHSSGQVVDQNVDERAVIQGLSGTESQLLQFIPDGTGYYAVKLKGQQKYLALSGSWNTYFVTDSTTDNSKFAIEIVNSTFVRLKCKVNGKYLGTDNTASGSAIYADKSGADAKHYWYISEQYVLPVDEMTYLVNPNAKFKNAFEGWGVSLCWWANMCGTWSDDKIDEIVDWLVSPEGLNYNIFRYNIGGGDDPLNRNCTAHHMANGKGIRAEMEGFKDALNADYNWNRDAAQRKIMLKIKDKRPDAIFEAFSNSAPYYMTYSGCCSGNFSSSDDNLKPEFYNEFANYLVDVCKFYKDTFNIEFKTLDPFNEPVTNYWGANGGQEGCHFSTAAQIDFLKILSPILETSGLSTVISASDESSVAQSVIDFKAYIADGEAINLVDQWNTHTYSASNQARANIRSLATAHNKKLWMSEVGSGGTGLGGNLNMAQKLMNDIRYLRPEAWVDWQYIEELNDQWCMVRGNFSEQTYYRVKNFYVRKQFSHYIKKGSKFLSVPNDNMLAALNPSQDSLTLVLLNNTALVTSHHIDLNMFNQVSNAIEITRTSESENNISNTNFELNDKLLSVPLPPNSITAAVIPITVGLTDNQIKTDVPYLIIPRTASLMVQSVEDSPVIGTYKYCDSTQIWKLKSSGSGYFIKNLQGKYLMDEGRYLAKTSLTENSSNQTFQLESVGDDFFKIISTSTGKVMDLEGAQNTAGTPIGFFPYENNPANSHRQWMFVIPPRKTQDILSILDDLKKEDAPNKVRVFGSDGEIFIGKPVEASANVTIYVLTGAKLLEQKLQDPISRITINPGIYIVIVKYSTSFGYKTESIKVLVK